MWEGEGSRTMLLSGMVLFSGIRVLAPIKQFLPIFVLFRMMLQQKKGGQGLGG